MVVFMIYMNVCLYILCMYKFANDSQIYYFNPDLNLHIFLTFY